jgi:hypothetical protein
MKMNDTAKKDSPVETSKDQSKGYYSFRFRSTGLGKQLLLGEPLKLSVVDDMLIMQVETKEPVQWVIRAGLTYRGILSALKLALNPSVIKFILFGWRNMKNPKLTDDF